MANFGKVSFLVIMWLFETGFSDDELNFNLFDNDAETDISDRVDRFRKPKFVEIYPDGEILHNNHYNPQIWKISAPNASINTTQHEFDDSDWQSDQTKYFPINLSKENGHSYEVDIDSQLQFNDLNNHMHPSHPPFHTKLDGTFIDANKGVFLIPDPENFGSYHQPPDDSYEDDRSSLNPEKVSYQDSENVETYYSYIQKIPENRRSTTSLRSSTTESPEDIQVYPNKYLEEDLLGSEVEADKRVSTTESQIYSNKYIEEDLLGEPAKAEEPAPPTENKISKLLKNSLFKLLSVIKSKPKDLTNSTLILRDNRKSDAAASTNTTAAKESKLLYSSYFWTIKNKIKNLFSLFTIIKFNNTECNATNWAGTWQGVCLTADQCNSSNGSALGTCANGYGVCCVFRGSCGDSSRMNCSYFKSPNYPDYYPANGGVITPTTTTTSTLAPTPDPRLYWYYFGQNRRNSDKLLSDIVLGRQVISDTMSCIFSVYKTSSNIQQFRVDFIDLDLAGPTNGTCTDERLVISGQNSNSRIPVLCGYNTGQHIYVDVSQLVGPLQIMVLSTTGARKRFKIKICQYSDSCSTSQSNCLQYYTGVTGTIQSFNYDQASMFNRSVPGYFNNLNYAICIRREAGYCSITYRNVNNGQRYPFQMVNVLPNGQSTVPQNQAGVDVLNCPDDYVIIDGTRLCGDRFNDGSTSANFSSDAAVTDSSTGPIVVNVRTNGNVTGLGFKFFYTQNLCT